MPLVFKISWVLLYFPPSFPEPPLLFATSLENTREKLPCLPFAGPQEMSWKWQTFIKKAVSMKFFVVLMKT